MTDASFHMFGGWVFNVDTQMFYGSPTLTESRVTWQAESCMDHPEPARGTFIARCPERVADVIGLEVGDESRAFVSCWGMKTDGSGVDEWTTTGYFEGYVDSIRKTRIIHPDKDDDKSRVAYHAVPRRLRMTSIPYSGFSMACEAWDRNGLVKNFYPAGVWSEATNGGQRLRIHNWSGAARLYTFQAEFYVPTTPGPSWTTGAAGYPRPGKFMFGVTQRNFFDAITVMYGGNSWPSYGVMATTLPGGTVLVDYSLTVPDGTDMEVMPFVAQVDPVSVPAHVELRIECSDALARLGRVYVGDTPWAWNYASGRIEYDLAPVVRKAGVELDTFPYKDHLGYEPGAGDLMAVKVTKLDADNRSALEVYRRTVAAAGRAALGLAGRVGISWELKPALKVNVTAGTVQLVEDYGNMSEVWTESIVDAPLELSTDRMANRIAASFYAGATYAETKQAVADDHSIRRYGAVNRQIDTDLYDETSQGLQLVAPNLWSRINLALDAQREPEYYLDGSARVIAREVDIVRGLAELVDNSQRYGRTVKLGGPGLPPGVSPYQRVRGSTFGYGGGKWHLELSVEPSSFSGVEAGRFEAAQARTELTFGALQNSTLRIYDLRDVAL